MEGDVTLDLDGFPADPAVDDLPAGMTDKERHEFAFRVIAEQGDRLGDYIFAAVHKAPDHDTRGRWLEMMNLITEIHGGPIHLTYRACDRLEAERQQREV